MKITKKENGFYEEDKEDFYDKVTFGILYSVVGLFFAFQILREIFGWF